MPARRITGIFIHKLFEQYNYSIPLNQLDRITILHGPNGCGKTTLFELINALLSKDMSTLRRVLFNSLTVAFEDTSAISVYSSFPALAEANINDPWIERGRKGKIDWRNGLSLYFALSNSGESTSHVYELAPARFNDLLYPGLPDDLFEKFRYDFENLFGDNDDPRCNEEDPCYTLDERRDRIQGLYHAILDNPYENPEDPYYYPDPVRFRPFPKEIHFDGFELPYLLCQALDEASIIYLDAERLTGSHPQADGDNQPGYSRVVELIDRVVKEKHRLRSEIIEAMGRMFTASFSEHLRLRMMGKESDIPSLEDLQTRWDEYGKKLRIHNHWTDPDTWEIVIDESDPREWEEEDQEEPEYETEYVNNAFTDIFGYKHANDFNRYADTVDNRVALTLLFEYYDDVIRLIAPFSRKLMLFRRVLRDFFGKDLRGKQIIAWSRDRDRDRWGIATSHLSSGEQQLIVLFGTMLFDAPENSLVLIDEPELSLHVNWQRQFLKYVEKIIAQNPIDVLIATHSPQIVHDRRDLTISLGLVE